MKPAYKTQRTASPEGPNKKVYDGPVKEVQKPKEVGVMPINNPAQPKPTGLHSGTDKAKPRFATVQPDSIPVPPNPATPAPEPVAVAIKKKTKRDNSTKQTKTAGKPPRP